MENYEQLILGALNGDTPREKYEHLKQLISDRNMYQVLVFGLHEDATNPKVNNLILLRDLLSVIEAHYERLNKQLNPGLYGKESDGKD